jgi:N-6 DNA methylase/type I restriction and modification enzyme subunit R-like protein
LALISFLDTPPDLRRGFLMVLRPFYRVDPKDWMFTENPDVRSAQGKALADPSLTEYEIEEYVRQWILRELVDTYHYPADWMGERIVVEETVQMATMVKQADISIKNERGKTFLYVETKNASVDGAALARAERQLEGYLSSTHTATIGMITNARTTKCVVKKVEPNDFVSIPDIPEYNAGVVRQHAKLVREITPEMLKAGRRTGLTPLGDRYESILFKAHSIMRDIDGLHADEALDELCKIIYAKIYDERSTIEAGEGASFRFQIYGGGNTEEIASNIRDLYEEARRRDVAVYAQRIPNYERSRGVFRAAVRLSSNCLVRVAEVLQNFSILDTPGDIKGRAFQQVLGPAIRAGMGQYFTPDPVVRLTVGILGPKASDLILDPFCGSGHFLTSCLDYVLSHAAEQHLDERTLYEFRFFHLHGIEKSDRMVRIAMTDMLLHDDGHSNIRNTDALLSFDNYPDIKALGGEGNDSPEVFDIVVTNPPFGSLMGGEIGNLVGRFQLGLGKDSVPLEVLALERCLQFLRPEGKLAIVLQDGILTDDRHRYVRDWYHAQAELVAVVSLPSYTFTPFGSNPKTSVAFLRKYPKGGTPNPSGEAVFYARIDKIGYDATGRAERSDDVEAILEAFHKKRGW